MSEYFIKDGHYFWPEPTHRFLHDTETDVYNRQSRVAAPDWGQPELDSTPETVPLFAGEFVNNVLRISGKRTVKLPAEWQSLMYRVQPTDLAKNYVDTQANGWFNSPFPNCETIGFGGEKFYGRKVTNQWTRVYTFDISESAPSTSKPKGPYFNRFIITHKDGHTFDARPGGVFIYLISNGVELYVPNNRIIAL